MREENIRKMAEEKTSETKRSKPKFFRRDWHKKIKLGSTVKKNRKWRAAKGRHNKIRLNRKGQAQRPKVGWSAAKETKDNIQGLLPVRVENPRGLESVKKGEGIIVANVGKKKKETIIAKAKEMKLTILNRYKKKE
jgi:ribosomal protein L32E